MIACESCGTLEVPEALEQAALDLHMRTRHPIKRAPHEHKWDDRDRCVHCPKERVVLDEHLRWGYWRPQ